MMNEQIQSQLLNSNLTEVVRTALIVEGISDNFSVPFTELSEDDRIFVTSQIIEYNSCMTVLKAFHIDDTFFRLGFDSFLEYLNDCVKHIGLVGTTPEISDKIFSVREGVLLGATPKDKAIGIMAKNRQTILDGIEGIKVEAPAEVEEEVSELAEVG